MCGSDRILRDREMSKSGGEAVGAGVVGVKWGRISHVTLSCLCSKGNALGR